MKVAWGGGRKQRPLVRETAVVVAEAGLLTSGQPALPSHTGSPLVPRRVRPAGPTGSVLFDISWLILPWQS